jgi:hypothetical protein
VPRIGGVVEIVTLITAKGGGPSAAAVTEAGYRTATPQAAGNRPLPLHHRYQQRSTRDFPAGAGGGGCRSHLQPDVAARHGHRPAQPETGAARHVHWRGKKAVGGQSESAGGQQQFPRLLL